MVTLNTAIIILLVYYSVFTPIFVLLVESRLKQIERQNETLLIECVKLKQKINDSKQK